ncbi:MAG: Hsp20/alpha crystallin family protein [Chloroflexota bacterium]
MSIQRWDPLRDIMSLREAMNSLLDDSIARPRAEIMALTTGMNVDVRETEDEFVVETTLPGVKPDDVNITILGDRLNISAEVRESEEHKDAKWLMRERRFGSFERTVSLPAQVRADDAAAEFNDGVLTIKLPKAEPSRPHEIKVKKVVKALDE